MKKLLILFIIFTLFLSGCGIFNLAGWVIPDDAEFLALIQELDTPQKILQYMQDNFIYETHPYVSINPYQLYLIRKGDCNDMATFAQFIANLHGYKTWSITIFYKNFSSVHVITVYEEDDKYSFSSNKSYFPYKYNTFLEIIEHNSFLQNRSWSKYIIYDYDMNIIEQVSN